MCPVHVSLRSLALKRRGTGATGFPSSALLEEAGWPAMQRSFHVWYIITDDRRKFVFCGKMQS